MSETKDLAGITLFPTKAIISSGGTFNLDEIVVTANYCDSTSEVVSTGLSWDGKGVNGMMFSAPTSMGEVSLTCLYTYQGEVKNADFTMVVAPNSRGIEVDLGDGIMMSLVAIPLGTFIMGSPPDEPNRNTDETQHRVTLTRGFYIGRFQITQEQYEKVMGFGSNPSYFKHSGSGKQPVESVTWYNCIDFCNKLSVKQGLSKAYEINGTTVSCDWNANGYRLPTEAEWEYACRANSSTAYFCGSRIDESNAVYWESSPVNYSPNFSGRGPHNVGGKTANAWGLHDMSGSVWEWCWDWYGNYPITAQTNPVGEKSGFYRILRGGSWNNDVDELRSACRGYNYPANSDYYYFGLRVVRPAV
ncbi:MAG: SUMF1/EgtB/PvdO family nonheme iron enzyme [Candidatus Riflebacteria bacterium]|nr:SUMF1/EgtB/PvdO family nonheme iron enzyme [Candidatus Riflebacteria bacterium]